MGQWALEMAEKLRKDGTSLIKRLPDEPGDIDEGLRQLLGDSDFPRPKDPDN